MLPGHSVYVSYHLSLQRLRAKKLQSDLFDVLVDVPMFEEQAVFSKWLDKTFRIAKYERLVLLPENLKYHIRFCQNHSVGSENVGTKQWSVPETFTELYYMVSSSYKKEYKERD